MAETSGKGRAKAPRTGTPEAGAERGHAGDAASAPPLPAKAPAKAPGALSAATGPKQPPAPLVTAPAGRASAILLAGNSRAQTTITATVDPDVAGSVAERRAAEALIVDVEGFEGPLDLLLSLSRSQKVDLRRISVLQLAEQYLAFVEEARALRIELAADYLVMAAWLAYLKSRLLLPPDPEADGPSGEDMAAHLAFQLERLQAMREAAERLMARPRVGMDMFPRGRSEPVVAARTTRYTATLADIMQAYARLRTKEEFRPYAFDRENVFTMEQALARLRDLIGYGGSWMDLRRYLPDGWVEDPGRRRSATAATFAATLELARQGRLEIRQGSTFAPIQIRALGEGRA